MSVQDAPSSNKEEPSTLSSLKSASDRINHEKQQALTELEKEDSWREYGRTFRQRLIAEDENAGGLTFRIRQKVKVERYFHLADKIVSEYLAKKNAQDRDHLLESYKQGNRLMKFLTTVLPTHENYSSDKPNVVALRSQSQAQVSNLAGYLGELALTIDLAAFNTHIRRKFKVDRGPPLESIYESTRSKDESESSNAGDSSNVSEVKPDMPRSSPVTMPCVDEKKEASETEELDKFSVPCEQVDIFSPFTGSHISLLETEEPRTPLTASRTSMQENKEQCTFVSPNGGTNVKMEPPMPQCDEQRKLFVSPNNVTKMDPSSPQSEKKVPFHSRVRARTKQEEDVCEPPTPQIEALRRLFVSPTGVSKEERPIPKSEKKVSFHSRVRERPTPKENALKYQWQTPSPPIKYHASPGLKLSYFLTCQTPVEQTPRSVADLSDWGSGDETDSTLLASELSLSGRSSRSVHYYQLATDDIRSPLRSSPRCFKSSDYKGRSLNYDKDDISLTNNVIIKRGRQGKNCHFSDCIRCLVE